MIKFRVYLILAFAIFLVILMPFSIVQGAPVIVQNQATMVKPYETGDTDKSPGNQAQAQYNIVDGTTKARAHASGTSNAWALAYIEDAFEIIHSSNYRITFSINYKGLIEVTGLDFDFFDPDSATTKVDLNVYLIDRSSGNIVSQQTAAPPVYDRIWRPTDLNLDPVPLEGSRDIVLAQNLLENHVYGWRAELRTEASAEDTLSGDLEVTVDFLNSDYGATITQVHVVDLSPDNIPPTTSYSLSGNEGENGWYTSSVTVELSATDSGYGVDSTNYRINGGSWTLYTSPFTVGTEGTNKVEYYSVDKANNKEDTQTLNVKIDTAPPTGQVIINDDDVYASSAFVTLSLTYEDAHSGVSKVRYSNDGIWDTEAWEEPSTTKFWSLTSGEGTKTVYYQVKDNAGKISTQASDTIILDTEPPTTTSSLSGTEGEANWYTSNVIVTLSTTDSGVDSTNYRINEGSWTLYTSPFTVGTEGTNKVEYYSVDKANNKEDTQTAEIKIDKTRPTGGITINDGDIYTSSTSITLSLVYDDTVSGVSNVRFGNDAVLEAQPWEDPVATKEWFLRSGEGKKTVYYQIKDKAGNISPLESDDIILDTDPPEAAIEINKGDQYTNSTSVTLSLQYSDNLGISQVRYRNSEESYTEWEQPSETKDWILSSGEGNKTVYAEFKDQAGLVSEISDSIILDTIPPTGSIEINNGASNTTSTSVTVVPTADDANGVTQMRLKNEGEDWNDWEEVSTKTWTLTSGFGTKTVFAQFMDIAGLVSPYYNATINLVETEIPLTPTPSPSSIPSERGNVMIYVKDKNNYPVFGATVTSTIQPTGQSPLNGTTDSLGAVTFGDIIVGSYSFHALEGAFGSENVQVNVLSQQTITVNITLIEDLTEPTASVSMITENEGSSQRVFSVTAEDDIQGSGIATITLYIDDEPVEIWTTAGTHIYNEGSYSNGTHTYYVEAIDNAGNTIRNPVSGYLEFSVENTANAELELWKILGLGLVLANGAVLVLLAAKRKK